MKVVYSFLLSSLFILVCIGKINAQHQRIPILPGLPTTVNIKVYLEGAIINPNTAEASLMRDDLRIAEIIPTTSPYPDNATTDAMVFNATGNDAIVDWIWVEVRNTIDYNIIVYATSALLQRDGDIVDTNGTSPVSIDVEADEYYYISIKHRNHLSILTASPIIFDSDETVIDFSTNTTVAFGGSLALRDMGNGIFAMYAGDVTSDGNILNTDISNAISNSGGINVYSGADANMDGNILNTDIALIIQPNAGRIQQF